MHPSRPLSTTSQRIPWSSLVSPRITRYHHGPGDFLRKCTTRLSAIKTHPSLSVPAIVTPIPTTLRHASSYSNQKMVKEMRPLGVAAALKAQDDPNYHVKPEIFEEFSLQDRVAVVTGGNGGLGLEMAIALCEAGAKTHALDLASSPSSDLEASMAYVQKLGNGSSLHFHQVDVTDQGAVSRLICDEITAAAHKHRLDICVAAAGILGPAEGETCLTYPKEHWEKVMNVNTNGVFYTCQAAAKAMVDSGCRHGSIIMIASMSGSVTNKDQPWVAYNTSKSAVLQMARSMACELGEKNIRVNTVSPGHIYTKMTAKLLDIHPETGQLWSTSNPLGRLGQVHELRGVV